MARFPQGQAVRLGGGGLPITIRDASGTLVNASATLVTVRQPAGTTVTYNAPTNDGTGLYHQDLTPADITGLGHYQWTWDATVSGSHAVLVGAFEVYDPFEVTVLPLQDAKDALNIPQTVTTDDDEIRRVIAAVEANLERMTGGPIVNTPIAGERVDMDASPWEIKVTRRPLVSVTSITDVANGLAVDVSTLDLDAGSAIIRRKDAQQFVTTTGVVTVTYVAGWGTAVPPAVGEAAAIILQHLWAVQRGQSSTPAFGGLEPAAQTVPGMLTAYPPRAIELLIPYLKAGAVG